MISLWKPPMPPGPSPMYQDQQPASNDNRAADVELDQFYTLPSVARRLYAVLAGLFDLSLFLMIEPSAGDGAFFRLMLAGSLGFDLDPKWPGLITTDFLGIRVSSDRKILILGNPPFGRNASMAKRFFNHAALQADVIAFILPRSFRKAAIQNCLNELFHLLHEEDVGRDAFVFRSRPKHVPAVFQVWVRRSTSRALRPVETRHPDFEFIKADEMDEAERASRADFCIQRVGARAGRVHHDFGKSPSSHYFIKGDVEWIMSQLDFDSVTGDVAGNPSLAKNEIVQLYREFLGSRTGAQARVAR